VDSLFVSINCVFHSTQIGNMVRDNRKLFLSKRVWFKFKGYAYGQMHKLDGKEPTGKRKESVDKYGFDVKYAYHIVRLMNECQQILTDGDVDLQRSKEELKSIRRGEWTEQRIKEYFESSLPGLEDIYKKSTLPEHPPEDKIKKLLLECLESHYGTLSGIVEQPDVAIQALRDIDIIVSKARSVLWENQPVSQ